MPDEILMMPSQNLLKLLEFYALGCIDRLPASREAGLQQRIQETYGGGPDWKRTLQGILKLDPAAEDVLRRRWQAEQERATQCGVSPDPERFVRSILEEIFPEQARPKPIVLPKFRQAAPIVLKAIGFWRDNNGIFKLCPSAQSLVRAGWHMAERERILDYLRSGFAFLSYGGWSTCRFGCAAGESNGCSDFTDGEWDWPEGLAHYVQCHDVMLPEEFVETMRANDWRVPDVADLVPPGMWKSNYRFWIDWAATHHGQGFQPRGAG